MSRPIRVLVVDDHSIIRFGYQQLLAGDEGIEVVAEAENCADALGCFRRLHPDVVILDLSMPLESGTDDVQSAAGGLEAIRRIRSFDERAKVLVVSGFDGSPYPQRAIQAGAKGYVAKRTASSELRLAVIRVASGAAYYSKSVEHLIENKDKNSEENYLSSLTGRELEIFSMIAEGHSVNSIAEIMHLSPKTVHAHRANLLRKLGLSSNHDIVCKAVEIAMLQT